MASDVKKQIDTFGKRILFFIKQGMLSFSLIEILNETNRKFTTSTTVNIFNDPRFKNIHEQHQSQRYELFRRFEQLLPNKTISPIIPQSISSAASSIELSITPIINK